MKTMKCIHPRRAHKIMKEFLNTASDIKFYDRADKVYYKTEINLHKDKSFQADVGDKIGNDETQDVYYNFAELTDKSAKLFRKFWTKREPMLKGFSDITISLLHELGHLETNDKIRKNFPMVMRELTMIGIESKADSYESLNHYYFIMPDEKAATEWAIKWLSKKKNRKVAKKFEKEFFKCFE